MNANEVKIINDAMSWLASASEINDKNRINAFAIRWQIYAALQDINKEIAEHFYNLTQPGRV